jgi:hypothetical protein
MDQFHAITLAHRISQSGNPVGEGPLSLHGLSIHLAINVRCATRRFFLSAAFGHVVTQKTKTGEQPVSMLKPIMDTVTTSP